MSSTFEFTPFDRQLLKIAAERACDAAKAAKNAAKKAYLTQAESEAHEMEGYADEAVRFLDSPEAIARETVGEDASEAEKAEVVQLVFGHRAALRVGCLILIKDSQKIIDSQTEMFADTTGQHERLKDFQRLEARLRGMNSEQEELPLATAPAATEPTAPADEDQITADLETGPFDAPATPARLALPSGQPTESDIPEADFEIVSDDPDAAADAPGNEAFALDEDEEHDDEDDEGGQPVGMTSALDGDDVEAWLNEPLRTTPTDAADDDLTS
ncbi:hypothetical protein [Gemmatimonas sp.]